jgi:hypothetical protein
MLDRMNESAIRVAICGTLTRDPAVRVALTPGCQIGYMDHTGCPKIGVLTDGLSLPLPGEFRLVTWTIYCPSSIAFGVLTKCHKIACP